MNRKRGLVLEVLSTSPELQELLVEVDGEKQRAYNYPLFAGPVEVGQEVLLNTTAVELGLGTGGRHFVLPTSPGGKLGAGHIMKLRYTPIQFNALSVEEEDSPTTASLQPLKPLPACQVVVATLHSLLPPSQRPSASNQAAREGRFSSLT